MTTGKTCDVWRMATFITKATSTTKEKRGRRAQRSGVVAETIVCQLLRKEGWTIQGQRLRTEAGEVDIAAELDGLLAIVEVKQRTTLAEAVACLSLRHRHRLICAAEILLATHPDWGSNGIRFDVIVVDAAGSVRRIADAFRSE